MTALDLTSLALHANQSIEDEARAVADLSFATIELAPRRKPSYLES